VSLLCSSMLLLPSITARGAEPEQEQLFPRNYLASLEYGVPVRILSGMRYANFRQATLTFSREWALGSLIFPSAVVPLESVLLELRLSHIWGQDIPLEPDEVSPEHAAQFRAQGRPPTASWDAYQIGLVPCYRAYFPLSRETRPYAELGAGFALLSQPLVDNGTIWNFSLVASVGIEKEIGRIPFYVVLRAEHFSNFGELWKQFGFSKANIGVESVALGIGVRAVHRPAPPIAMREGRAGATP
jgi:hypothetical protein